MVGARGFARMQELSVLLSRHVPAPAAAQDSASIASGSATVSTTSSTSTLGIAAGGEACAMAACDRPRWTTYRYYSRVGGGESGGGGAAVGRDCSLGEMVKSLSVDADAPCARSGCAWTQGEHVMRLVHAGVRISVSVGEGDKDGSAESRERKEASSKDEGKEKAGEKEKAKEADKEKGTDGETKENLEGTQKDAADDTERIHMWLSCALCGKRTDQMEMNDGA
jgi:1-phosphatidylinositol-3-phosphate 5-kinase